MLIVDLIFRFATLCRGGIGIEEAQRGACGASSGGCCTGRSGGEESGSACTGMRCHWFPIVVVIINCHLQEERAAKRAARKAKLAEDAKDEGEKTKTRVRRRKTKEDE